MTTIMKKKTNRSFFCYIIFSFVYNIYILLYKRSVHHIMTETLKNTLDEMKKEGRSIIDYESFKQKYASFNRSKNGYINPFTFFDEMVQTGDLISLDDLKKKFSEKKLTYEFYSYCSETPFSNDITVDLFDDGNNDNALALFSIHTGVDARAGFSDSFAVVFNNHYDFTYEIMCTSGFELITGTILVQETDKKVERDFLVGLRNIDNPFIELTIYDDDGNQSFQNSLIDFDIDETSLLDFIADISQLNVKEISNVSYCSKFCE